MLDIISKTLQLCVLLLLCMVMSNAQCFYPNGSPSKEDDIPCGKGGITGCCPLDWACQPNGLCYLQNENYYGRYTCTDSSWGPGCPNICTYGDTANGNEAVLECEPGSYCCDHNRPELSGGSNCCDASPSRFTLDANSVFLSTSASFAQTSLSTMIPTPASLSSVPTSPYVAPISATSPSCNSGLGERICGSVCCTTGQSCQYPGQCAASGGITASIISISLSQSMATSVGTDSSSLNSISSRSSAITYPIPSTTSFTTIYNPNNTSTASISPPTLSATGVTQSKGFLVGVTIGGSFGLLFIVLALYVFCRGRQWWQNLKSSTVNRASDLSNIDTPSTAPYGMTIPPSPHPYYEPFPFESPTTNNERGPRSSRSRTNGAIIPDHDHEDQSLQPNLMYAPALNPYNVSHPQ